MSARTLRVGSVCRKSRGAPWAILWAICVLGASACAFSRGDLGVPFSQNDLATIQSGRTTQAQVVALLGAPDSIKEIGQREVFHYYRYTLKHASILVFTRVNIASDDLYVFFDRDGVVTQVLSGNQTKQLKFQFWPFGQ